MTKQVQLRGSSAESQDTFIGAERELTVDTTNDDLRLHDGTTPGGRLIPNRDNNDQRYQAKSPELGGLNAFLPEQRGFLARLGPGDYRLRSLTVNGANLSITNGDGYAGNPTIGLSETISSEHTWTGQHLFTDLVEFGAGINADVAGDLTGNVTGNVVGNVTGNLTGNAAGNHTGSFTGNANFVGFSVTFAAAQIPTSAINGLAAFVVANALPSGVIMMWSGSIATIPAGWVLCDGTNGTPDLRSRFVYGAGSGPHPAPASVGGAATHGHTVTISGGAHDQGYTVDSHALTTSQMPAHTHFTVAAGIKNDILSTTNPISQERTAGGDKEYGIQGNDTAGPTLGRTSEAGSGAGHSHGLTAANDGSHTHTSVVSSQSNIPPYFALCFIMRQ